MVSAVVCMNGIVALAVHEDSWLFSQSVQRFLSKVLLAR